MDPLPASLLEHGDFVRRLARRLLRDEAAADDVAQDAWVALLERGPGAAVREPRAFVAGIVRNLVHTRRRRARREVPLDAAGVEPRAAPAPDPIDEAGRLLEAVGALREPYRRAIVQRYYEGLAPRAIARRTGEPVETVKARLKRGLAMLRAALGARDDGRDWRRGLVVLAGLRAPAAATALVALVTLALVLVLGAAGGLAWLASPRAPAPDLASSPPTPAVVAADDGARPSASPRRPIDAPRESSPDPAGPVFPVHLRGVPAGAGPFTARLSAADPDRVAPSAFTALSLDPPVAARFGPDAAYLRGGSPWQLEIRSDDGSWYGRAPVASLQPPFAHVVVDLQPTGSVAGRLRDPTGAPVREARVALRRLDAGDGSAPDYHTATDERGRFRLPWIPPGTYHLIASSHRHAERRRLVTVEAGILTVAGLELEATPGHDVAGRLVDPPPGAVFVLLREVDGDRAFTRRAAGDGTFRFEGVPPGDYELTVHTETLHRITPARVAVTPPDTDLELRCVHDANARDLTLRAVDADTGAALPGFDVFVRLDGRDDPATTVVLRARGGAASLRGVPPAAALEWIARAPGHVPARGDEHAFAGRDVAEVRMRPGWGNRFTVEDAAGRPLPGVPLLVDDMAVGATGDRGQLDVVLPTAPRVLRLGAAGGERFSVTGGDVDPSTGRFLDLLWGVRVVAAPAPTSDRDR